MLSRTADVEYPDCVDSDEVEYDLALEERTPKIAAEHVTSHIYGSFAQVAVASKSAPTSTRHLEGAEKDIEGERLIVSIRKNQEIEQSVVWVNDWQVGH